MILPWWRRFDWWLIGAMGLLLIMGLSMIASSTLGTNQPYFYNQLLFATIGWVVFGLMLRVPSGIYLQVAPVVYLVTILMLAVVSIFGTVTRGAVSWLYVGPFAIQPSEFAKLGLVLSLAWLVLQQQQRQWSYGRFLGYSLLALALPLGLTLFQPDFGSAMVMGALWAAMMWMSGLPKQWLGLLGVVLLLAVVGGWFGLEPYQKQRIFTFLDPAASPLGAGYNVLQSIIAVGSGQFWGRGWGRGTQSHLNFLPEHHTDFIFAMLSEEWGFVGSFLVVFLFMVIVWRGFTLIWRHQRLELVVMVSGILMMLLFQAAVNMAMNVGMAPVTGIPLPLVSYGGSSLLTTMMAFGLLERLALEALPGDEKNWDG